MSLTVRTRGGGSSGPSASIFVKGLSETDTVSASKDGKTVQGVWVEGSTTSGFLIAPIKSFGTWTVTATNGEDTVTQDVLVDVFAEFEIEMSYAVNYLMLYDYGDECEDVTGGWTSTYTIDKWGTNSNFLAEVTPTKEEDSILLTTSNTNTCCPVNTVNKVELSKYNSSGVMVVNNSDVYGSCQMVVCTKLTDNTVDTTQSTDKLKLTLGNASATSSGKHLVVGELTDTTEACYCAFTTIKGISSDANSSINMFAYFLLASDDYATLCAKAGLSEPTDLATLIADTASIETILDNENAVKYMVAKCTGDFMASFVASSDCLNALKLSPYKELVHANKHWRKFLEMVDYDFNAKVLWLYREGDECEDVTGGWDKLAYEISEYSYTNTNGNLNVTKNENVISGVISSSAKSCCGFGTQNKIDLSDVTTVYAHINSASITKGNLALVALDNLNGSVANFNVQTVIVGTAASAYNVTDIIVSVDVSAINSACYVMFGANSGEATNIAFEVDKVWLE